jgi:hypothetical protein
MKCIRGVATGLLVALAVVGLVLAGAPAQAEPPAKFDYRALKNLDIQVSPEAKVMALDGGFKKYKGAKSLYFKVTLKNVSNQPQRYRVNIFLDNNKAVGGLIPRKTKKGLVKPGAKASFTYPFKGVDKMPGAVTVLVKTLKK